MPSSLFSCVLPADLQKIQKAAQGYKTMSQEVPTAANKAGEVLKGHMVKLIRGDSSLARYRNVADALTVFEDDNNDVVVGLPPGHTLLGQAEAMEQVYPVQDTVIDLAKQAGDVEEAFCDALAEVLIK